MATSAPTATTTMTTAKITTITEEYNIGMQQLTICSLKLLRTEKPNMTLTVLAKLGHDQKNLPVLNKLHHTLPTRVAILGSRIPGISRGDHFYPARVSFKSIWCVANALCFLRTPIGFSPWSNTLRRQFNVVLMTALRTGCSNLSNLRGHFS